MFEWAGEKTPAYTFAPIYSLARGAVTVSRREGWRMECRCSVGGKGEIERIFLLLTLWQCRFHRPSTNQRQSICTEPTRTEFCRNTHTHQQRLETNLMHCASSNGPRSRVNGPNRKIMHMEFDSTVSYK